ncbi:MAG TPA: ABC transporter substrate-binding protein [Xanthobacteraceae bacterium]|nr:ABC transporter substrate-binding protein [Xanthobacteraceae bacterium]
MKRLGILIGAGLVSAAVSSAGPAHAQTKLKMMYTAVSGFTASYVAQEQGFFKKRGIDMEFIQTMSSGNNPPALVSGSVQVAGPTLPTLLQANDSGLDLVIIGNGAVYPLEADILVARQGSDIKSPADLKGKTVGVPGIGALLHFMLVRNLQQNGVDPKSVRFIEVAFPQAADALKSGQIDAYPAQAPFTARILQSGAGYEVANWLKNTPDGTITVIYATTRKWAEENKDTVKALQEGMREAVEFSKNNRPEMYAAIAKYTKLPAAVVSSLAPPNLQVDTSPQQVKFWVDLAKEQGAIKGNPDPAKIIFKP